MFQPLAGIRVVDLTASVAGPYCGLILAGLGADVIKIEHPERGDDARGWGPPFWNGESAVFLVLNAGKRSLGLDVKSPEGLAVAQRLIERSDVFVQSLRPGLAERLGLGFEQLAARNPRLVYCTIGAFGAAGPRSGQPGYDPLMQAAGGIMSVTGEPGRPPVRAGISAVDQGTGMWSALAILAALMGRDAAGRAQLIDTSLFETAVNWVPYQIAGYLGTGRTPRPMGSGMNMLAPYEAFRARDGWVMLAAGNDRLFAALCEALGAPELAGDARFLTNADRVVHREELAAILGELVARDDSATRAEQARGGRRAGRAGPGHRAGRERRADGGARSAPVRSASGHPGPATRRVAAHVRRRAHRISVAPARPRRALARDPP